MDNNKEGMENQNLNEEVENVIVESVETKEEFIEEPIKKEGKFMKWIKVILSGAVDQLAAILGALILYILLSLILKVAGYKIVEREDMFLIVFIISNVLYYPLVQEFLGGKTLGKKLVIR